MSLLGASRSQEPAEPRFLCEGLADRIVRRLRPSPGGRRVAATDDGLYQLAVSGIWEARSPVGEPVFDVTAIGRNH